LGTYWHSHVGPGFDGGQQGFQPVRIRDRVVVQNGDERRLRFAKGLVDGRPKANICLVCNNTHPAARLHCAPSAVVYHDHLKIRKRLTFERCEAFR